MIAETNYRIMRLLRLEHSKLKLSLLVTLAAFITGCGFIKLDLKEPLFLKVWVVRDLSDPPYIISLIFTVENRGNRFVELTLRGRPAHDFVVSKPDGTEIWRWAHGKTVQPLLIPKILNPGDYLRFEAKWDQRDNEGRPVPLAHYVVRGLLNVAPDKQLKTPPTRLWAGSRPTLTLELELPALALQDKYWRLGSKLPVKLKLKNISDRSINLTLLSRPAHDFIVTQEDREIWRWSHHKAIEEITEIKTLAPGEELDYVEIYNLQDNESNPILPGHYCIKGILNVDPPGKLEAEQCLTIGPGLSLRLTLEAPKGIQIGDSVPLKLRIENIHDKVLNLTVGYAPYDFIVTTPNSTEVWRWSYGKAFPLTAMSLTLQPGEVKEYSEIWDQLDNEGYPVSPGTYIVRGFFRGVQQEGLFEIEQSEPLQLIIKP